MSILSVALLINELSTPNKILAKTKEQIIIETNKEARALELEAKRLYQLGKYKSAIAPLQQAISLYQNQGNTLPQALALSNLSLIYQALNYWQQAYQTIATSSALLEKLVEVSSRENASDYMPGQKALAQVKELQGNIYFQGGKYSLALASWQVATEIFTRLGENSKAEYLKLNQAQALQNLGLPNRAIALMQDLLVGENPTTDNLVKLIGLRNWGNSLRTIGE
ncbi:MAG: hypothetical protein D6756_02505, partial [Cyanobacteria bacterium J083]